MKKKLAILLLFFSVGLAVNALPERGSLTLYPRLGVNFSKINDEVFYADNGGVEKSVYKVGLTAGVELQQQFADYLGFSFGTLYSMQSHAFPNKYGYDVPDYRLHYLNVPLLLVGYLGHTGIMAKAGIQAGWLLGARYDGKDVKDQFRSLDFTVPVGVGYQYGALSVDVRYHIGLSKPQRKLDELGVDVGRTSCFQLTVGYAFSL